MGEVVVLFWLAVGSGLLAAAVGEWILAGFLSAVVGGFALALLAWRFWADH